MWQRIQTLYLGIATALVGSMFFCNIATIIGPEGTELGIRYYEKTPYLLLLISLITAQGCALATYKIRLLQMRVCILSALILIGFQIWLGADFLIHRKEMIFSVSIVFPIAAAILDILAAKNIMLDESMVIANRVFKTKKKKNR